MLDDGMSQACNNLEQILRHDQSALSGLCLEICVSAGEFARLAGVAVSPFPDAMVW